MSTGAPSQLASLLGGIMSQTEACATLAMLDIAPVLATGPAARIGREQFAMALAALLFAGLLERVPSGRAYVDQEQVQGRTIMLDHGALRTIRLAHGPTGALPAGRLAFARILEPLGYRLAGTYPLPRLRMTGYVWCHEAMPEILPQYFVSELEVARFDPGFATVAARVFGASRDPLGEGACSGLARFAAGEALVLAEAAALLRAVAGAFGCQHHPPALADYEALLAQSPEAAWIATEGNAFNHATNRVADVAALAERLRGTGLPVKAKLEVSASGRVRQTALRADPVMRDFLRDDGTIVQRAVPGSFFEFITRDVDPATGTLDLAFDSGNATGIFGMTRQT